MDICNSELKGDIYMPIYVGICGKAGAGKGTVGKMLTEEFNSFNILSIPFAYDLKIIAKSLGWDGVKDEKGRRLLQILGTDLCRGCIRDDYWIDRWEKVIDSRSPQLRDIIIAADVRFDDEAKCILGRGGYIIEINSGQSYYGQSRWEKFLNIFFRLKEDKMACHPSELGISRTLIDYTISNNSSLEHLKKQVMAVLEDIRGK